MRLFLVRHAEPDYPNNTITPVGHKEAAALGERFGRLGLDVLYTSPLGRARDTMAYTAERLNMEHAVLDWTAELGHWRFDQDGQKFCIWDIHGETVRTLPTLTAENWWTVPPFNDPVFKRDYDQLVANSDALLARHGYVRDGGRYRIVRPNRDRIAIFCHGGLGLTWLAHLLYLPLPLVWASMFLPPSSVTTILFDERSPHWATPRAVGIGDVSHLYAAGLPVSPSGIKANVD